MWLPSSSIRWRRVPRVRSSHTCRSAGRRLRHLGAYAARYDARPATVAPGNRRDDGQPEAVARNRPGPVGSAEPVEGVPVELARDAGTLVDDVDPHPVAGEGATDADRAGAVLESVREQVADGEVHPGAVQQHR